MLGSFPTGTPTSFQTLKYVMAFSLFRAFICLYFLLKQWLPNFLLTIIPSKKYSILLTSEHINLHIKGRWVPHDNTSSMFCSFFKKSSCAPLTSSVKTLLPLLFEWLNSSYPPAFHLDVSCSQGPSPATWCTPGPWHRLFFIWVSCPFLSKHVSKLCISQLRFAVCLAGHTTKGWRRGPVCAVPHCIFHIWVNDQHDRIYIHIPWMADWVGV